MNDERHRDERTRLQLERLRDVLFEARVILGELERDNSVSAPLRHHLAREIGALEDNLGSASIERAVHVRDQARRFYAPPRL